MSEEFEKIKNEVNGFRQDSENKKELAKRAEEERIKKEELILEKSGVRELFEEIRDSGLVKWRVKTTGELSNRKRFFRSFEKNLEYYKAHIESEKVTYHGIDVASLSLQFDYWQGWGDVNNSCRAVVIAVVGEEVCLLDNNSSFTPIKQGEVGAAIAKALKNPVPWRAQELPWIALE